MQNSTTISRPYVHAVFDIAEEDGDFKKWGDMLLFLSVVCKNTQAKKFLENLSISAQTKADFICSLGGLTDQGKNLVKILSFT